MDGNSHVQVMEINRDYLRIIDNIICYLDSFNQRFMNFETDRIQNTNEINNTESSNSRMVNPFSRRTRHSTRRNRNSTSSFGRHSTSNFPVYRWPTTFSTSGSSQPRRASPIRPPPVIPPPPPLFSNSTSSFRTLPTRNWSFTNNTNNTGNTNNTNNTNTTNTTTNTSENTDVFSNLLNNTLYGSSYRNRHPTYNDIISSTTTCTFSEVNNITNQTMCPISREQFDNYDIILKINHCGHIFKKNSLLNWFETSSKCPVCRHDIRHSASRNANSTNATNSTNTTTNSNTNVENTTEQESITQDSEDSTTTDLSNNEINNTISNSEEQFQNLINNNITQVLDNIGNVVLDNIEDVIGQALNNVTDLSNNQMTAGFEYSVEIPGFGNVTQSNEP